MNQPTSKSLTNRLSRIIGQLNAVKTQLESDSSKSCQEVLNEIKAADSALKKFAEAYVSVQLQQCISENKSKKELEKQLQSALAAAFNM